MKTIAEQLRVREFPFIILDKNGNEIYLETSDGHWVKKKYDSNGNRVYYEDSSGYWYKIQYDSNGNEVHYENSKGFWSKTEYDSEGYKVYYVNSNGIVRDKRNIPEYTMEQLVKKIGNFKLKQ